MKRYCNTLSSRDDSQSNSSAVLFNQNSDQRDESVAGHVSLVADNAKYDLCVNESSTAMYSNTLSTQGSDNQPSSEFTNASLDHIMMNAYGATLLCSDGGSRSSQWCQRWSAVIQHQGRHYSLPGGSIGKKYIDLLLHYLSAGAFPSERVIVVMLQHDRLVRKGSDIRRLLEGRMAMWKNGQFDALLQEAARCDLSLRNSHRPTSNDSQDQSIY